MGNVYLRTGAEDIYFSKPKQKKQRVIRYTVKKEIILAKIDIGNITLIITNNCSKDFSDCALRAFCSRKADPDELMEYQKPFIPKYSKFIGQLGGMSR